MSKIRIAFRLQKEYADILFLSPNPSQKIRELVISGLNKAEIPHEKELSELIFLREEIRRIGINHNQLMHKINAEDALPAQHFNQIYARLNTLRKRISLILQVYDGR